MHTRLPGRTYAPVDKEVWFPTLEHLFELQKEDSNRALTIVEAWAADMPSNGRAAVLNEHLLGQFSDGICKCTPYRHHRHFAHHINQAGQQASRALQVLLKSDMLKGDDVIGIGYSAGACVMYAIPYFNLPFCSD